jgi:hypothetical protein
MSNSWQTLVTTLAAAIPLAATTGCSLGQGEGVVESDSLYAADCWLNERYDMQPDFFAGIPYRNTLQIRVQRGNDLTEVSDGLAILIDDVELIRTELLGQDLCVALPVGVEVPGGEPATDPVDPVVNAVCGDKFLVHAALYLQSSCHNQNIVLYAVAGTIRFDSLFSNDPQEKDAAEKFTDAASFDLQMGDPRDAPAGAPPTDIPADKLSNVTGNFSFYFERGQPGQPFP